MNIFFLHRNPKKCAKYHVDRHVVKMILETAQMLCTAIWIVMDEDYLEKNPPPYKKTHYNHPSNVWARKSKKNWQWLHSLGLELCKEYTYRYGKVHKSQAIIESIECPSALSDDEFTSPTPAMPDKYKGNSSLKSYRRYYLKEKSHIHIWKNSKGISRHAWKKRKVPKFILQYYPFYANLKNK